MRRPQFDSWFRKIHGRKDRWPTPVFLGFPGAQLVKNPPAMWQTWVQTLGWEDPLEKGKATHSSVLACRIPWTVYIVHGVGRSRTRLSTFHFLNLFVTSAVFVGVFKHRDDRPRLTLAPFMCGLAVTRPGWVMWGARCAGDPGLSTSFLQHRRGIALDHVVQGGPSPRLHSS